MHGKKQLQNLKNIYQKKTYEMRIYSMFETEELMAQKFSEFLEKRIVNKSIDYVTELLGVDGIPDCVVFEKTNKNIKYVISYELKLKNWKRAMKQAFRYKLFSNEVYVVMDKKYINSALKNINEFYHYNIGLASFSCKGELYIYFEPETHKPFSFAFFKMFYQQLLKANKIESSKKNILSIENLHSKFLKKKIDKIKKEYL